MSDETYISLIYLITLQALPHCTDGTDGCKHGGIYNGCVPISVIYEPFAFLCTYVNGKHPHLNAVGSKFTAWHLTAIDIACCKKHTFPHGC